MTRAADSPRLPRMDPQGFFIEEPRAKSSAEIRQETVYDVVRQAAIMYLRANKGRTGTAHECLSALLHGLQNAASVLHYVQTRPISDAIHDALAETMDGGSTGGVEAEGSKAPTVTFGGPATCTACGRSIPQTITTPWACPCGSCGVRLLFTGPAAREDKLSPDEKAALGWANAKLIPTEDWDVIGSLCYSTGLGAARHQNAVSAYIASHIGKPAQPPPAEETEPWMAGYALGARAYVEGQVSLYAALSLYDIKQEIDHWLPLVSDDTPFPDLSPEDQAYIRLIASADGA